jgi:hypothetical protein
LATYVNCFIANCCEQHRLLQTQTAASNIYGCELHRRQATTPTVSNINGHNEVHSQISCLNRYAEAVLHRHAEVLFHRNEAQPGAVHTILHVRNSRIGLPTKVPIRLVSMLLSSSFPTILASSIPRAMSPSAPTTNSVLERCERLHKHE